MKKRMQILVNGIFKENPVLVLVLGCCSVLAISVTVKGSLGMGAALTFVLVGSNVVISALRKIIPDKIRIPCYIVVVATFVTLVEMVVHAYLIDLYNALGIFLPLIVVNCIVLGRAEMFANKNNVLDSLFDGLGMGIGYTLVLTAISVVRELLGSGSRLSDHPRGVHHPHHLPDAGRILHVRPCHGDACARHVQEGQEVRSGNGLR